MQKSFRSLVRYTPKSQSHALEVAASFFKFEHEKVALKEQIRRLENEIGTLKEEKIALTAQVGELEREGLTLKARFATHVKEIDTIKKQSTMIKARLLSPPGQFVGVQNY